MTDSRLLRGTFILTAAIFISKFLGMIYVFPFYALIGERGAALYTYAYLPYSVLISLSTMGVPLAVSKFVSKYNALGDYQTGRRIFRSGIYLMALTGVLAFIGLFLLAPSLAPLIIGDNNEGNSFADVTYVIRMVSIALMIVPVMSLIRGFFQGYSEMEPTAYSQVIEQLIRIAFILIGSYVVIKVLNGDVKTAVGLSTFAAFVGALGSLAVLLWFWLKRKPDLDVALHQSTLKHDLPLTKMYKELLTYAGPIVFVGLAIPLYQLIDQFTFNRAMGRAGNSEIAEIAFSTLNFSSHKLVMIPVSLATALALTLIPTITKSFTDRNVKLLNQQITQAFQIIIFLTVPAVIGLSVLSYPAYGLFYDAETSVRIGGFILRWYAPIALLFALFTVTAAILQGINQQRFSVITLSAGVLVKLLLNGPLIEAYSAIGSIIASAIGYLTAIAINLWVIKKYAHFHYQRMLKRSLLICIFVFVMAVAVIGTEWVLSLFVNFANGRWQSLLITTVSGAVGASLYIWLSIRSNLAGVILGERFTKVFKKRRVTNE